MKVEDIPKELMEKIQRECTDGGKERPQTDQEKHFKKLLDDTLPCDKKIAAEVKKIKTEEGSEQLRKRIAHLTLQLNELASSEVTANALTLQYEEQLKEAKAAAVKGSKLIIASDLFSLSVEEWAAETLKKFGGD